MITSKICDIKDAKKISGMCTEIWHECYKTMLSYEQRVYMLQKFMNEHTIKDSMQNDCKFHYIYLDNKLAGFFAYYLKKDHIYLSKLYSYKEFRGNGIFKFIFNYFSQYKMNIKLNTCKTNNTLQIYLHVGFEIIEEQLNDIGNGYFMDDYVLLKTFK